MTLHERLFNRMVFGSGGGGSSGGGSSGGGLGSVGGVGGAVGNNNSSAAAAASAAGGSGIGGRGGSTGGSRGSAGGGYGQNMGRIGTTPGVDPDTSPAPDVTGISTGQSPFGALGQPDTTSSTDTTSRANAHSTEAAASQHAAATEHGIAADLGRYGVITGADAVDTAVGAVPGIPNPAIARSVAETMGNTITSGIEGLTGAEAEMGVGEVGSADPSEPGVGPGPPGGSGDGGGAIRRAKTAATGAFATPNDSSSSGSDSSGGAFDTQGYNPYGGDYSTYGQPGGTSQHVFFPDISGGVKNAWDSVLKGKT